MKKLYGSRTVTRHAEICQIHGDPYWETSSNSGFLMDSSFSKARTKSLVPIDLIKWVLYINNGSWKTVLKTNDVFYGAIITQ